MKKRLSWLVVVTIIVVLGVAWYYYDSMKKDDEGGISDKGVDEVAKVLNKDLEESYPYTAREVVQFFIRIQKCYYNEDYTDEELVKLAYKATELFDDELKAENQFDEYFEELKEEIDAFESDSKVINRVILEKSSEVVYSTVDEQKYASINCTYYIKGDAGTSRVMETYILRKDEAGRWKILGWKEYEGSEWE